MSCDPCVIPRKNIENQHIEQDHAPPKSWFHGRIVVRNLSYMPRDDQKCPDLGDRKSSDSVRTRRSWWFCQNAWFSSILELSQKVMRSYSSGSASIAQVRARRGPYTSILSNAYRYSTMTTLFRGENSDFLILSICSNIDSPMQQKRSWLSFGPPTFERSCLDLLFR